MRGKGAFADVERHKVRRKILGLAHGLPGLLPYEYGIALCVTLPCALVLLLIERVMAWVAVFAGVAAVLALIQLRQLFDGRREYVVLLLRRYRGRGTLRILDRDQRHEPFGGGTAE